MTRDKLIDMNKEFHDSKKGPLYSGIDDYRLEDAFTPEFFDHVCRFYDISHYAHDINNKCFMKYVSKNRNHAALCYYAVNNHMYLNKDRESIEFMVKSSIDVEKKYNTSLLEVNESKNKYFLEFPIYENLINIDDVEKQILKIESCTFMYSRTTHHINDILEKFIIKFNHVPVCRKTNIQQFIYKINKALYFIFCCDPNDINVIDDKDVKQLCHKLKNEWVNQTYVQLLTTIKMDIMKN
jgi:hypothetical protein